MKQFFVFALIIFFSVSKQANTYAQEVLTLQDAVRIALERNFDIKLSQNSLKIEQNNVSLANAGMLPFVNGNLTNNNGIQSGTQTFATGTVQERVNARSESLVYGASLGWTVFDGFGMFARYDQLKELRKLGEANLQTTILARVSDVIATYYNLVLQQQQIRAFATAVNLSRMRVQLAQNRFQIGKAARLEVLNAQVDFNTDTTNYLRQLETARNTQIQLNNLLARDVNTVFTVNDSIQIDDKLVLEELNERASKQNPQLRAALISQRIARLDLKQVRAERYPVVNLNTAYNFTRSESEIGIATQNRGRGLTYGLSASVNLFNGFLQRRNEKNAAIAVENAELEFERLNELLRADLSAAYQTYLTNLALVKLEENNQQIARQNLDITMEKFRLGSITQVEVRDAQQNFVNASVRFSNAQYLAKVAEISLKEIAGNLNLE